MKENIRKSALAGSWYPGDPHTLRSDIISYIRHVPDLPRPENVIGMIVPHAGYAYSGQVAAYAYQAVLHTTYDAIIIVSPSHRVPFRGVSVIKRGGFETPLGIVPVDGELADSIMIESSLVAEIPSTHLKEHSIEIQLPFLQCIFKDFSFVPLMMGSQDRQMCVNLAAAIGKVVGERRVLIIGSSDLSHFHSYDAAQSQDIRALGYLERMDAEGFLNGLRAGEFEACGGGPAAVTLMTALNLGATDATLLKYANSGDVTGDRDSVVGYGAVIFTSAR